MAIRIRPKDGERHLEQDAALAVKLASSRPWIVSGLALGNGTGLNASIAAGMAWIDGYVVELDAAEPATCAPSQTNHIWLELAIDGNNLVTGLNVVVNTTDTPPSGPSVKLGTATTDGSAVTGTATTGRSPETQVDPSFNVWGHIGGTLSDQTDLQSALNAKRSNTMATSRILGRVTGGSGGIEELTAAQVLSLIGISMPIGNGKTSSQTFNSTTWTDVTGLSVTGLAASATYEITVKLIFQRISGTAELNVRSVVTGRSGTIYANYISTYQNLAGSDVAHTQQFSYAADNGTAIPILQNSFGIYGFCQLTYRFTTGGSGGTFKIQAQMSAGSNSALIETAATIMAIRAS